MESNRKRDFGLTPLEYKLLYYLVKRPEQVYSRNQLLDAVWGTKSEVYDRTVDAHICTLRKKLQDYAPVIEAVPGVGYRYNPRHGTSLKGFSEINAPAS